MQLVLLHGDGQGGDMRSHHLLFRSLARGGQAVSLHLRELLFRHAHVDLGTRHVTLYVPIDLVSVRPCGYPRIAGRHPRDMLHKLGVLDGEPHGNPVVDMRLVAVVQGWVVAFNHGLAADYVGRAAEGLVETGIQSCI